MASPFITILGIEGRKDKVFRRVFHIPINGEIKRTSMSADHYLVYIQTNGDQYRQVVRGDRIVRRDVKRVSRHWSALGPLVE